MPRFSLPIRSRPRGRPRGTLYAVYRFLEDDLGVRWWNTFEKSVPRRPTLRIGEIERRGHPAFERRDLYGTDGTADFLVRNRVNGANSRIAWTYGEYEGFATPWFVHSFYLAIPPEEYFESHPEYFSERARFRVAGESQPCLTNPELPVLVAAELGAYAAAAEAKAEASGAPPPAERRGRPALPRPSRDPSDDEVGAFLSDTD